MQRCRDTRVHRLHPYILVSLYPRIKHKKVIDEMEAKGYKSLRVYQDAHRLAVEIHQMSLELPKFEMFEEGSQVRRSSKAISTNLVEGYGRRMYKAEYLALLGLRGFLVR